MSNRAKEVNKFNLANAQLAQKGLDVDAWMLVRGSLYSLVHATKVPDGWKANWLRPLTQHPIAVLDNLTQTEIVLERGDNSYDRALFNDEDYHNLPQFYVVKLGEELATLVRLSQQLASGDSTEYYKYVAEHGIIKMDARVKLLEQEGEYPAGTPNLTVFGPPVSSEYPNPYCLVAYCDELDKWEYVTLRYYVESTGDIQYFNCPVSKLAVVI